MLSGFGVIVNVSMILFDINDHVDVYKLFYDLFSSWLEICVSQDLFRRIKMNHLCRSLHFSGMMRMTWLSARFPA